MEGVRKEVGGDRDAKNVSVNKGGYFTCRQCGREWHFDYFGQRPPFAPLFVILEEAYVIRDPFPPSLQQAASGALCLGAKCSQCGDDVCQSKACSMFYGKRFCMTCAASNRQHFPSEIQKMLSAP